MFCIVLVLNHHDVSQTMMTFCTTRWPSIPISFYVPCLSDISSSLFELRSFMICHRTRTPNSATGLILLFWFVHVSFCLFLRPFFGIWHHIPHAILRKLHIMKTSMGIEVCKHIGFCCYSPCCGGRKRMFETESALSLHLAQSPACEQFANERDRKRDARKQSLLDAEIVVQSSKRPMPLRRDVVNDITHTGSHDYENKVLTDWSDFNFPTCMATKWTRKHKLRPPKQLCTKQYHRLFILGWRQIWYCLGTRSHLALPPLQRTIPLCSHLIKSWQLLYSSDWTTCMPPITPWKPLLNGDVLPRTTTIHFIHRADCRAPNM